MLSNFKHIFPCAIVSCAAVLHSSDFETQKEIVFVSAVERARQSLPLFLDYVIMDEGYARFEASVMVSLPVENHDRIFEEHVWVGPFQQIDEGEFSGILANQPTLASGKMGEEFVFAMDQIVDWSMKVDSEEAYGNFTARSLANVLSSENSRAILAELNEKEVPLAWVSEIVDFEELPSNIELPSELEAEQLNNSEPQN